MPALSIVIPCYNYGKYLGESLNSVLSQDYIDYEIVLVDDGSTDETPKIGANFAKAHPHIRYIRNPRNLGVFNTCHVGLDAAQGEYIHFFSSDDRQHPGFLSKSMHMLCENSALNLVCSIVGYFQDGSDVVESKPLLKNCSEARTFSNDELIRVIHDTDFFVPGTSCIVKRELIDQYGRFDPKMENIADWFLFHKIAFSEGIGYIPETLISMRVHDQALTSTVKCNKERRRATFHQLLCKLRKDKSLRKKFLEAGLLKPIFRDLKWKLYLNPKYACYWNQTSSARLPRVD